jgi:hypothetical protein
VGARAGAAANTKRQTDYAVDLEKEFSRKKHSSTIGGPTAGESHSQCHPALLVKAKKEPGGLRPVVAIAAKVLALPAIDCRASGVRLSLRRQPSPAVAGFRPRSAPAWD